MKARFANKIKFASVILSLAAFVPAGQAQLTIPYADGSDGALNITANTVIDLSQAVTGVWTNTSGSPGNGIYDPTQWAVVFKYSSVSHFHPHELYSNNYPCAGGLAGKWQCDD